MRYEMGDLLLSELSSGLQRCDVGRILHSGLLPLCCPVDSAVGCGFVVCGLVVWPRGMMLESALVCCCTVVGRGWHLAQEPPPPPHFLPLPPPPHVFGALCMLSVWRPLSTGSTSNVASVGTVQVSSPVRVCVEGVTPQQLRRTTMGPITVSVEGSARPLVVPEEDAGGAGSASQIAPGPWTPPIGEACVYVCVCERVCVCAC